MMGAGKTEMGRFLANLSGLPLLDSDFLFSKEVGLPPAVFIRRFGEAPFRKWENRLLSKLLVKADAPLVLATGGGAILDPRNLHLMRHAGFVVWLDPPLQTLLARLRVGADRPLLPHPLTYSSLKCFFEFREPFYRKCHLRIRPFSSPSKAVAMDILKQYKEHCASRLVE